MALPKLSQPTFEFVIPSNNKKIKLRPMLVKDEKILLMAKQSQSKADVMNSIKQVVNTCIMTDNITVDKLAIFDLEYLFLKLRSISISNITKVSYMDSEDEKRYDFDIDLDSIKLEVPTDIKKTFSLSKTVSIELSWPSSDLYTTSTLYEKDDAETFEYMLTNCLSKVYDGDQAFDPKLSSKEELKEFIDNIPTKTAEEIREFFSKVPSLKYVITYKNSKGTDREIVLNTLDDFFML